MWRRVVAALGGSSSAEVVGRDAHGNVFQVVDGRRTVVFGDSHLDGHSKINPAWSAWLSGARTLPPSAQELAERERGLETLRCNVAKLELEDAKMRAKEQAQRDRGEWQ